MAAFLFSNAQVWTALSIWRRLLMQAFFCDCVRARTKLGIAIAASKPMMATTIMISTSVNPFLLDVLFFILTLPFCFCGVNRATSGFIISTAVVHKLLVATASGVISTRDANRLRLPDTLRTRLRQAQKGPGLLPGLCESTNQTVTAGSDRACACSAA